ncbi:MAG: long-chain fatty acid--CoA ligase, partial [Variovorax sp.]
MTRPHHKFWPQRLPHSITVPATSLWHNLATSAARFPDKAALVFFGQVIPYREFLAQTERLAGTLHALGVQRGDRVVLDMQNCPQLVIAHFAILRANAVVVPVNPMNRAEELKHYITDPDAKVAITTGDLAAELAKASNALAPKDRLAHMIVTQFTDAFDADVAGDEAPPVQWRDWLLTRHPLPHNHSSLNHNAFASQLWGLGSSEAIVLAVVPMFHITGTVSMMHTSIVFGGTLVIMPRWDRDVAGRLISRWKVTSWTNIPTMVIDLLASPNFANYDLSSLTYIGGGGAAMPQAIAQRLLEQYGLKYNEGYGLTETAAPSHANPFENPKQQCLGIPYMSTDSRVVDPDTLVELPIGESGEIITHGPEVFQGYWKRPDATAAALVEFEGKRFFRTGDMGRMDEDGYFFMTDRLKRMINASGFKVWPAEVELLMFRNPAIQEACVISMKDA